MKELFRLKVVSKRQVTLPQRLMSLLRLDTGDELWIEIQDNQVQSVKAMKLAPAHLLPESMLGELRSREREIEASGIEIEASDLGKTKTPVAKTLVSHSH